MWKTREYPGPRVHPGDAAGLFSQGADDERALTLKPDLRGDDVRIKQGLHDRHLIGCTARDITEGPLQHHAGPMSLGSLAGADLAVARSYPAH